MLRQVLSLIMVGALFELIVADAVVNRGVNSIWLLGFPAILAFLIIVTGTLEQLYSGEDRDEP